eukprot:2274075-Rhodomonas_salina.2
MRWDCAGAAAKVGRAVVLPHDASRMARERHARRSTSAVAETKGVSIAAAAEWIRAVLGQELTPGHSI